MRPMPPERPNTRPAQPDPFGDLYRELRHQPPSPPTPRRSNHSAASLLFAFVLLIAFTLAYAAATFAIEAAIYLEMPASTAWHALWARWPVFLALHAATLGFGRVVGVASRAWIRSGDDA